MLTDRSDEGGSGFGAIPFLGNSTV